MSIEKKACLCSFFLLACSAAPVPATQTAAAPPAVGSIATSPQVTFESKITTILAGPQRSEEERARDAYRHPKETLEFFRLTPRMNVVELSAGRGWFTAILGPLLSPEGKLTITGADPKGPSESEGTKNAKSLQDRLAKDPTSYSSVSSLVVDWKAPSVSLGPDGSADLVLTFRNLHGWIRDGVLDKVLASCFRVLKPGGTLGVEEHRAKADAPFDPKAIGETGYVPEAFVIQQLEKAGFVLIGQSEVNANPKDTKDHPKGVWTLPPTLRLGAVDQDKYRAIGESDRMTLRFSKP